MNTYEEHVKTLCQPILLTIQTVSWTWEGFSGIVGTLHRIVCMRELMESNEKEENPIYSYTNINIHHMLIWYYYLIAIKYHF